MSGGELSPVQASAAEAVAATLRRRGVKCAFGLPGTQNLGVFEMLRRAGIPLITTATETGAAFAAIGYARASRTIPLLVTIPGPGALYALPGVAEARDDSTALVWIVAAHPEGKRRFALHSLDIEAAAKPAVKQILRPAGAAGLPAAFETALAAADSGEPGPVLVIIDDRELDEVIETPAGAGRVTEQEAPAAAAGLAERLSRAERPLFFFGRGAEQSRHLWLDIAARTGAAMTTTLSGRGIVPETEGRLIYHDFSSGTGASIQRLFERADLVLALGVKFSHNGTGGFSLKIPQEKLIHIDRAAGVLNGEYPASLAIESDLAPVAKSLLEKLKDTRPGWQQAELDSIRAAEAKESSKLAAGEPWVRSGMGTVHWRKFFEAFFGEPQDWIITTDSGLHQFLVRRLASVRRPCGLLTPSDFQSMGFSIPAAIGAALSGRNQPPQVDGYAGSSDLRGEFASRRCAAVVGDGGLLFSLGELATARRERLDLVVVVINDGGYGLIRRQQIQRFGVSGGMAVTIPDLPALAASLGARYVRYRDAAGAGIGQVSAGGGLTIVEVETVEPQSIERMRLKAYARETVRRLIGPKLISKLRGRR